jgi:hypothetical protein
MAGEQTRWIRMDAAGDLLNSLEHTLLCLTLARSDPRNWKWTVIAAHSAAQIAMVTVLMNAQREEHIDKDDRKLLLAFLEESRTNPDADWPDTKLAKFLALYGACRKYLPKGVATEAHRRDLVWLNGDRNDLIHFGQADLSIAARRARMTVRAGIKLVDELSPNGIRGLYRSRSEEARHELAITSVLRLLDAADADDAAISTVEEDAQIAAFEARLAALDDDDEAEQDDCR